MYSSEERELEGPARLSGRGRHAAGRGGAAAIAAQMDRRRIAEWLLERLVGDVPTLVGIDHGQASLPRPAPVS
jgi:hypothetical protein